jgi:hypothetical protein
MPEAASSPFHHISSEEMQGYVKSIDLATCTAEQNRVLLQALGEMRTVVNSLICELRLGIINPDNDDDQEKIDGFECAAAQIFARVFRREQ